jgi:hypothetical protein
MLGAFDRQATSRSDRLPELLDCGGKARSVSLRHADIVRRPDNTWNANFEPHRLNAYIPDATNAWMGSGHEMLRGRGTFPSVTRFHRRRCRIR